MEVARLPHVERYRAARGVGHTCRAVGCYFRACDASEPQVVSAILERTATLFREVH